MLSPQQLFDRLDALGLGHRTVEHAPVFTVEQAKQHRGELPGHHIKNLFLRNKKEAMWLVVALEDRAVDLKRLGEVLGAGRLSFGSPERLSTHLGVEPGSVTPLAIVNDTDRHVTHVLDKGWIGQELVACHPLQNDATTVLAGADLLRFIRSTGYEPVIVDLDEE